MQITGYLKTSLIEWPGKISSVIFTPGCNFRCPFCHNADLVGKRRLTLIPEDEVFADLTLRKKWVDAVVITGGEPTLQKDLDRFLGDLGKLGFLTMIHTNGTRPEVIKDLIKNKLVDYICMDLKGDLENYDGYTGYQKSKIKNQKHKLNIKNSMGLIIKSGIEYELRTTVVPGLHDLKNLKRLASQIKVIANLSSRGRRQKPANTKWYLQQFRPMNTFDKKYLKIKPFSKEEMEGFQKELQEIIPNSFLRGI